MRTTTEGANTLNARTAKGVLPAERRLCAIADLLIQGLARLLLAKDSPAPDADLYVPAHVNTPRIVRPSDRKGSVVASDVGSWSGEVGR
jgi:hypothetical protein